MDWISLSHQTHPLRNLKKSSNMFITLLIVFLAIAGWLVARTSDKNTYGSNLENYINSKHPQHSGDVDRLTNEFHWKQSKKGQYP